MKFNTRMSPHLGEIQMIQHEPLMPQYRIH